MLGASILSVRLSARDDPFPERYATRMTCAGKQRNLTLAHILSRAVENVNPYLLAVLSICACRLSARRHVGNSKRGCGRRHQRLSRIRVLAIAALWGATLHMTLPASGRAYSRPPASVGVHGKQLVILFSSLVVPLPRVDWPDVRGLES